MKPPIIGTKIHSEAIDSLIDALETIVGHADTFYVGYPVAATADSAVTVPALLISDTYGLVCFDVVPNARATDLDELKVRQKRIVLPLKAKLLLNSELAGDDDLGFRVNAITFALVAERENALASAKVVDADGLAEALKACVPFDTRFAVAINAAIERVANIRPKSKRALVKTQGSKGSKLKRIEGEIANLDSWQKAAAIETPNGPQRIRGLAGSGKTVVLALKAAYLHGAKPEWQIRVTYHTRALTQQLSTLIRRFYFEDYREEPDAEMLKVLHSFGSASELGFYSEICRAYGVQPHDWGYAKRTYGYSRAFGGICGELLRVVERDPKELFDVVLIDEAQDLPREFLRLAYLCTREHRIVWAYDDFQNLGDYEMASLRDTFGVNKDGGALVSLTNSPKQPRQDIILPRCYRNTPWALVAAHALGAGVYRHTGDLVQHPDDPVLWQEIGYAVVGGSLKLGAPVELQRSPDATPSFFSELLTPDEAIQFCAVDDEQQQFLLVAESIASDVLEGELFPHDIAVVFPNALEAEKRGALFRQFLADRNIDSHMVGVTSSRDTFHVEGKVAVSGPHRAKGNEAPVVYVMDAQYCAGGLELIKKRNLLFTAITRSRGWVRVYGYGAGMRLLMQEFEALKKQEFKMKFTVPTEEQLRQMRTLYRDISQSDRRKVDEFQRAFERLAEQGSEMPILQLLPKDVLEKLQRALKEADDS